MISVYCIIFKRNEDWILFTNQIFMTEAEALDFGKRSNIKYKNKKTEKHIKKKRRIKWQVMIKDFTSK